MHLLKRHLLLLSTSLALTGTIHAEQSVPEAGRWITESGNLEVEVAPCGQNYCGTIVRVIANRSMSNPTMDMALSANDASPVGKNMLTDMQPMAGGGWQGHIYNRENNKIYNCQLTALNAGHLKLTIYEKNPAQGKVQVWRRPAVQ